MSSSPKTRLEGLLGHFLPSQTQSASGNDSPSPSRPVNYHTLSPTFFLPRAAAIEPEVCHIYIFPSRRRRILRLRQAEAIYHLAANKKLIRRSYRETADRARGLAYYLKKHGFKRVGILAPNTPAFLESIFGIAAAGAVNIGKIKI